jgi:hypothetical protein
VGKQRDFQVRAPLRQRGAPELDPRKAADLERGPEGVEREVAELVERYGPDPDRLVSLLAGRPAWERARAVEKLTGDYGAELAQAIGRAVDEGRIGEAPEPGIARLRDEVARHGAAAHGRLLVATAERRVPGKRRDLSDPARAPAAEDKRVLAEVNKPGGGQAGPVAAPVPAGPKG